MARQTDVAMIVFSNIIGTYNMLDASKDIYYKKFINFSTSSVLLPKETFYSASKAGAERLANAFAQTKPVLTVRPYSIYGEGEADFRFIPTVIKYLLNGEKMQLEPFAYHDWVYIGDFTDTLIKMMDTKTGIVNMGTGSSCSNLAIIEHLEEISGKKLKYTRKNMREFDTKDWVSPDKTVKYDLRKGLEKTYAYYEQKFKA